MVESPFERQSPSVVMVDPSLRAVMLQGKAEPEKDLKIQFAYPDEMKSTSLVDAKADGSGTWTIGQQYIGGKGPEKVRIEAIGGEIAKMTRIDYRSLFLVPAGTALGASLLLLLFFHPPRRAEIETGVKPAPPH